MSKRDETPRSLLSYWPYPVALLIALACAAGMYELVSEQSWQAALAGGLAGLWAFAVWRLPSMVRMKDGRDRRRLKVIFGLVGVALPGGLGWAFLVGNAATFMLYVMGVGLTITGLQLLMLWFWPWHGDGPRPASIAGRFGLGFARFLGHLVYLALILNLPITVPNLYLFDDDLKPEVTTFLNATNRAKDVPDNGFVYFQGVLAPLDQDPMAWGRIRVNAMIAEDAVLQHGVKLGLVDQASLGQLKFSALNACDTWENCKAAATQSPDLLWGWLAEQAWLGPRCDALAATTQWQEIYVPSLAESAIPTYTGINACRSVAMVKSALAMVDGDLLGAMNRQLGNLGLGRRMLANGQTVFSKVFGMQLSASALVAISDLLRASPELADLFLAHLPSQLAPLSAGEMDLGPALATEGRAQLRALLSDTAMAQTGLSDGSAVDQALQDWYYQKAATANEFHDLVLRDSQLYLRGGWRGNDPDYAAHQQMMALYAQPRLHNVLGQLLNTVNDMTDWFGKYVLGMHDLDGLARLVALQARIPTGIDKAAIEALLAADKAYFDPYTGKPMVYDAARHAIGFKPKYDENRWHSEALGKGQGRVAIRLNGEPYVAPEVPPAVEGETLPLVTPPEATKTPSAPAQPG